MPFDRPAIRQQYVHWSLSKVVVYINIIYVLYVLIGNDRKSITCGTIGVAFIVSDRTMFKRDLNAQPSEQLITCNNMWSSPVWPKFEPHYTCHWHRNRSYTVTWTRDLSQASGSVSSCNLL